MVLVETGALEAVTIKLEEWLQQSPGATFVPGTAETDQMFVWFLFIDISK